MDAFSLRNMFLEQIVVCLPILKIYIVEFSFEQSVGFDIFVILQVILFDDGRHQFVLELFEFGQ